MPMMKKYSLKTCQSKYDVRGQIGRTKDEQHRFGIQQASSFLLRSR